MDGNVLRFKNSAIRFHAPDVVHCKGCLWSPWMASCGLDASSSSRTVSIVRRQDRCRPCGRTVRFIVFDAPAEEGDFESRMAIVRLIMEQNQPPFACMHTHERCRGAHHLQNLLAFFEDRGGEGLMLRQTWIEV